MCSGVREVHPVEWSKQRRAFAIHFNNELFGSVELNRDEDDRSIWELAVVLADHKRSLDGARSAVAAMFYAFEVLKARSVWFWVSEANAPIHFFAKQMRFTQLNSVKDPGGTTSHNFELGRAAWQNEAQDGLQLILSEPVEISDHERTWRGDQGHFTAIGSS